MKHNKDQEEHEYEKQYLECTGKPSINHYNDPSECIWRFQNNQEIKGMDQFMKRAAIGREQDKLRAARESRFGIIKQTKSGKKKIK